MGEYSERWRHTHNWLAKFGDDLLSLRDAFKAAGEVEAATATMVERLADAEEELARTRAEIDVAAKRLAEQRLYVATAEEETAARRAAIDAEIVEYKASRQATADHEVIIATADTRRKVETDLVQLRVDLENKTANRDALEGEVATLVERAQVLDRLNAEKTERLRIVESRLAEAGKFALGSG
jgi:chromosome segregation ATPase